MLLLLPPSGVAGGRAGAVVLYGDEDNDGLFVGVAAVFFLIAVFIEVRPLGRSAARPLGRRLSCPRRRLHVVGGGGGGGGGAVGDGGGSGSGSGTVAVAVFIVVSLVW